MKKVKVGSKYEAEVRLDGRDCHIILRQLSTKKEKQFVISGRTNIDSDCDYMASLTDGQCDMWFKGK